MKHSASLLSFLLMFILFTSCDDKFTDDSADDEGQVTVTIENFEITIDENPERDFILGTVTASTNTGSLSFSILSQSPEGALNIDSETGELTVADPSLFEFDNNPTITATVEAQNGDVAEETTITIILNEIQEEITVTIEDFEVIMDENPEQDQVLGTVTASTNIGSLSFLILTQSPEGALAINSETGELTAADPSLYEFDENPTITATIEASNGDVFEEAMIVISLKEIDSGGGASIWDGPKITFEKMSNADPTLAENQDRITENVWITRASRAGLFNAKLEMAHSDGSPADTEWARGSLASLDTLTFTDWKTAVDENPPGSVNQTYVVHLISEDIYLELTFLSWGIQSAGGNFSYERSTSN